MFGGLQKKGYDNEEYSLLELNKNIEKNKLEAYIKQQECIYKEKTNEFEEIHIASDVYEETYCSFLLENAFLILSTIMNKYIIRNKRKAFNLIETVKPKYSQKSSYNEEISSSDLEVYNIIFEKLKKVTNIIEKKFLKQKGKAFDTIYITIHANDSINKQLIDSQHFDKKTKINKTRLGIQELEEYVVNLQRDLKKVSDSRDHILLEVKHSDLVKSDDKIKDRSLEIMLQDKKIEKYEKENKEIKSKLEKKEKEVKKFMSEMNKILQLYDDTESGTDRKIQSKKTKEKITDTIIETNTMVGD